MKRIKQNHVAWDHGTIRDTFERFLGKEAFEQVAPRTVKTLCGRRVRAGLINNHRPTCNRCITAALAEVIETATMALLLKG